MYSRPQHKTKRLTKNVYLGRKKSLHPSLWNLSKYLLFVNKPYDRHDILRSQLRYLIPSKCSMMRIFSPQKYVQVRNFFYYYGNCLGFTLCLILNDVDTVHARIFHEENNERGFMAFFFFPCMQKQDFLFRHMKKQTLQNFFMEYNFD